MKTFDELLEENKKYVDVTPAEMLKMKAEERLKGKTEADIKAESEQIAKRLVR